MVGHEVLVRRVLRPYAKTTLKKLRSLIEDERARLVASGRHGSTAAEASVIGRAEACSASVGAMRQAVDDHDDEQLRRHVEALVPKATAP